MISRNFKKYNLGRQEDVLDEYGQAVPDFTPLGTVEFSITLKDYKILPNNPIYLLATHIGITKTLNVKANDVLQGDKNFKVLHKLAEGRYQIWLLQEIE